MSYGEYRPPRGEPVVQLHVGENPAQQYNINNMSERNTAPDYLGKPGTSSPNSGLGRIHPQHIFDVGIFKDTLAPNLALHSSLAVVAWGAGRYFNYVESKDVLWSSGQLINTWWSAVGSRVFLDGIPLGSVFSAMSWPERLILGGTTLWGGRLTYRIISRALRRQTDDPRYAEVKKEEGFWNKALLSTFIPEAVIQALIALPLTAPFRHQGGVFTGYHPLLQTLSVGLFTAGFTMETLADIQLSTHKVDRKPGMLRDGVWSIVRHPNYLGDALIHFSFPLLLFSSDMLAPVELLGPLANYLYLRYWRGDKRSGDLVRDDGGSEEAREARYEKEDPQKKVDFVAYKRDKNAFWPALSEVKNEWTWIVVGAGVAGMVVERGVRAMLH